MYFDVQLKYYPTVILLRRILFLLGILCIYIIYDAIVILRWSYLLCHIIILKFEWRA